MTSYTVDLKGSGKFNAAVAELRKLSKRRNEDGEPLAEYDSATKLWTVHDVAHGVYATILYLRDRCDAKLAEVPADPAAELRAERERLVARIAEIDAQLEA